MQSTSLENSDDAASFKVYKYMYNNKINDHTTIIFISFSLYPV